MHTRHSFVVSFVEPFEDILDGRVLLIVEYIEGRARRHILKKSSLGLFLPYDLVHLAILVHFVRDFSRRRRILVCISEYAGQDFHEFRGSERQPQYFNCFFLTWGRLPLPKQTGVTLVASLSFQCPSNGTASKSFRQSAFPRGRHASSAWASTLAWVFPSELLPSGLPECARLRIPASLDRSRDPLSDPHDLLSSSALLLARSLAASAAVQAALAVLEAQTIRTLICCCCCCCCCLLFAGRKCGFFCQQVAAVWFGL